VVAEMASLFALLDKLGICADILSPAIYTLKYLKKYIQLVGIKLN
jgi:hypothetical protein